MENLKEVILKVISRNIGHDTNKNVSLSEIKQRFMGDVDKDKYLDACIELIKDGFLSCKHKQQDYVSLSQKGWDKANTLLNPSSEDLKKLVEIFENYIRDIKLNESEIKKVKDLVATIKSQLSDKPDSTIINQAGRSLRNVTEGAIGSLLAAAAQAKVWDIAHRILLFF